jgi:integrase
MFHSVLACELASFMELRRATCTNSTVATNQSVLLNFDSYLAKRSLREKHISERTIAGWMETQTGKRCTLVFKIGVLQQFLHYLNRLGLDAFVPETPVETDDYAPYVFSDEEMHTIFMLADNLNLARPQQCKTIQLEFSMILRLLYGCGLRIGETLALKTTDVDLDGGILVLKYTKGQKQRLVPMDPSLASILNRYCIAMGHMGKPDAYLFPGATLDQPLTIPSVQARFHRLLKKAEIVQKGRQYHERGPCLHCFRHVFAVRSFVAAEMAGRALADSVPYLSVYLGHTSLNETDKYLKYCSELYPDAIERFSVFTQGMFREVAYEEE